MFQPPQAAFKLPNIKHRIVRIGGMQRDAGSRTSQPTYLKLSAKYSSVFGSEEI